MNFFFMQEEIMKEGQGCYTGGTKSKKALCFSDWVSPFFEGGNTEGNESSYDEIT